MAGSIFADGQVTARSQGVWLNCNDEFILDEELAGVIEGPLGDNRGFIESLEQKCVCVILYEEQSSSLFPASEQRRRMQMDRGEVEEKEARQTRVRRASIQDQGTLAAPGGHVLCVARSSLLARSCSVSASCLRSTRLLGSLGGYCRIGSRFLRAGWFPGGYMYILWLSRIWKNSTHSLRTWKSGHYSVISWGSHFFDVCHAWRAHENWIVWEMTSGTLLGSTVDKRSRVSLWGW